MSEEPELQAIRMPPAPEQWQQARAAQRAEARRRWLDHVRSALAEVDALDDGAGRAEAIVDALLVWKHRGGEQECHCSCHPRLPDTDFHDYGFGCPCRQTAEERAAGMTAWRTEMEAFWDSPEGRRITEARHVEQAELDAWLADNPDVEVTTHGGFAPEQWTGRVDGRTFYFRERHDQWHIELDLRPSGRFYRAWTGGDLDDDANYEQRETEEGDVIAEGTTGAPGYATSPVERARFIAGTVRRTLQRERCDVHTSERADLELLLGRPMAWCPACGTEL